MNVIVVGGGIGGLACAAALARQGASVRVLERASHLGGRAASPKLGGVPLNLGAHAFYVGGPAQRVLDGLGISYPGSQPSAREVWLSDAEGVFASPTSLLSLLGARRFTLRERASLMRFFATLDRTPAKAVRGLSTTAWLDRMGSPPAVRRFFDAMVRVCTFSNAPDDLPAEIALRQLQTAVGTHAKGVVYIDGGWESLVRQLADAAVAAGATLATGANVVRVTTEGSVLLEDGSSLEADHVVVALPRGPARRLVPAITDADRRSTVYAACLDLVLDAMPSRRLVFGLDEPHYFSVHDRATAPPPLRAHAFRYLAPGEDGSPHEDALRAWLARVAPDLEGHVIASRFLPHMEVSSALAGADPSLLPSFERLSFAGDWLSARYVLLDAVAESVETVMGRLRQTNQTAA